MGRGDEPIKENCRKITEEPADPIVKVYEDMKKEDDFFEDKSLAIFRMRSAITTCVEILRRRP